MNRVAREDWLRVADLVGGRLGLHFPPERQRELQRGLAAAARELQWPDFAAGLRSLLDLPPHRVPLAVLARHLTVGETYFLRDAPLMAAMAERVLPDLIRARRARQHPALRLWSAGCASGEEAWSLAILAHRALPDLAAWRVRITATDVNPAALQKAREGVYGDWSFRSAPAWLQPSYFERRPDGRHAIAPFLRPLVQWSELNLVEEGYPSCATGTDAMDVVFCRNVLMYLRPDQAAAVVARLRRSLVDGGWLVVAASEAPHTLFEGFTLERHNGALLYRKRPAAAAHLPRPAIAAAAPVRRTAPRRPRPAPPEAPPSLPRDPEQEARASADGGDAARALAGCDRWIAAQPLNPAAHYLRAAVLLEQGRPETARHALRAVLFLDPAFVLAHVALGQAARMAGDAAQARRHFHDASRLLARMDPQQPVPEGDGLDAARLAHALQAVLEEGAA